MEKNLPSVITLKKSVMGVVMGIAVLIVSLVTYNVYQGSVHSEDAQANSHIESSNTSSTKVTWYIDQVVHKVVPSPSASHASTAGSIVDPSVELSEQDNIEAQAMAAAITSNQLLAEGETPAQALTSNNLVENTSSAINPGNKGSVLQNPSTPYSVQAGTLISALLLTGISAELPKDVVAQVRSPIYDSISGQYVLIPAGAKLIGSYDTRVAYSQKRLAVSWQRLIFPNGQSIDLQGMPGMDASGTVGFADQVDNHTGSVLKGALLSSVLSMGSLLSSAKTPADPAIMTARAGELYAQNLAATVQGIANPIAEKQMNVQPTLLIRPGYAFIILVTHDMVFPGPYTE